MLLTMREQMWKKRLVDQAGIRHGQRILDVGCGTLDLLIKSTHPDAEVIGLDPDPEIPPWQSRRPANRVPRFVSTLGTPTLPYPDASDCELSSLVFHHLSRGRLGRTT